MSKIIKVKGFKDKKYKICVSIKEKNKEDIISNISELKSDKIDLIEWRADYFEYYNSIEKITDMLKIIKKHIGDIPLIFTFKSKNTGGMGDISIQYYIKLIKEISSMGLVDIINLDLVVDYGIATALAEFLHSKEINVILPKYNIDENSIEYELISV